MTAGLELGGERIQPPFENFGAAPLEEINKVFITGAQGFVGRSTVEHFLRMGWHVRAAVRSPANHDGMQHPLLEYQVTGDMVQVSDWRPYIGNCNLIVHLAARAHQTNEGPTDSASEFDQVNVQASIKLATNAAAMGVKRFVFISSAGVMGERSEAPFREVDAPRPVSEYAKSKYKAEISLTSLCENFGMELVVLRPTLVYGPGNPGNLERLLKLVESQLPLPLDGIRNKRSLVQVGLLAKVIYAASVTPEAAGTTLLVSDGEDLSTSELTQSLAEAAGIRLKLFFVPRSLLFLCGMVIGKSREIEKLSSSFQVDSSRMRTLLGIGVVSTRDAIKHMPFR